PDGSPVALGQDGLEDPPRPEAVLAEAGLGVFDLVRETLVLRDSADQSEDRRDVRAARGTQRDAGGRRLRPGAAPPRSRGRLLAPGRRGLPAGLLQWSSTILSPAFFIEKMMSAPSSALISVVRSGQRRRKLLSSQS